jgi:MtN3 and saliva related transmembrane protein
MSELVTNVVGTGAAVFSMASFTPQLFKIWKERDASSVSLRMFAMTVTAFALWIIYGIMLKSWPITGSNVVCLLLSAGILHAKWKFRDGDPEAKGTPAPAR